MSKQEIRKELEALLEKHNGFNEDYYNAALELVQSRMHEPVDRLREFLPNIDNELAVAPDVKVTRPDESKYMLPRLRSSGALGGKPGGVIANKSES